MGGAGVDLPGGVISIPLNGVAFRICLFFNEVQWHLVTPPPSVLKKWLGPAFARLSVVSQVSRSLMEVVQ